MRAGVLVLLRGSESVSVSSRFTFSWIGQELDGCLLVFVLLFGVCLLGCVGFVCSWPFILIELSNNDYFSIAS